MSTLFDSIQPIDLSEERKVELEVIMQNVNYEMTEASIKIFQSGRDRDVKKLRKLYLKHRGTSEDPLMGSEFEATRKAIADLEAVENEIISGYFRIVHGDCDRYYRINKDYFTILSLDDYQTEAYLSMWESMYSYNERSRFSTFVRICVKNHLFKYIKNLSRHNGAPVVEFDENVLNLYDYDNFVDNQDEIKHMADAVENADLDYFEREMIKIHLSGDKSARSRFAEEHINPNTGRPYTKQLLSLKFKSACKKCEDMYNSKKRAA